MKLIKPSFEILTQESGVDGLLKHIERCGRTAYRSEDKITEDSAAKFVQMLIERGHGASLEHGSVYLTIPNDEKELSNKDVEAWRKLQILKKCNYTKIVNWEYYYYITTNYRVIVENNLQYLMKFQKVFTPHKERVSVKFICDRGVSHEFVRHRTMSFTQESTRYCNYSKDKFDNQVTFILPEWLREDHTIDNPNHGYLVWYDNLIEVEENYKQLLKDGWTPQQARSVLPNALKTELVMTGFISDWQHFFELRCAPDAHPDARALAIPLREQFIKLGYINE